MGSIQRQSEIQSRATREFLCSRFSLMGAAAVRHYFARTGLWFAIWLVPLLLVACDLNQSNRPDLSGREASDSVLPVSVITLEQNYTPIFVRRYSGLVEPIRESELSFSRPGVIAEIQAQVGATVADGEVLAALNAEPLVEKKTQLQAQLKAAQTELEQAQAAAKPLDTAQMLARVGQLQQQLTMLEEDLRSSSTAVDNSGSLNRRLQSHEKQIETLNLQASQQRQAGLESQIRDLQTQLTQTDAEIDAYTITSPFDGVVVAVQATQGATVAAGHAVVTVADLSDFRISVQLPARLVDSLAVGQNVSLERSGEVIAGETVAIHPTIDSATQTRTAVFRPLEPQPENSLTVGERIDVLYQQQDQSAGFWVPIAALSKTIDGLWSVCQVEPIDSEADAADAGSVESQNSGGLGRVVRREVSVKSVENDRALIAGNVTAGMQIVDVGLQRIVDGQRVSLTTGRENKSLVKDPGTGATNENVPNMTAIPDEPEQNVRPEIEPTPAP